MRVLPRTRLALFVMLLATVFTTGAFAQDYYYTNFLFGHIDYVVPSAPCAERAPAQAWTYQGSAWMLYHCADGSDIQRRFIHPSDATNSGYATPAASTLPAASSHSSSTAVAACDATKMVAFTGLNECQWQAKYPR